MVGREGTDGEKEVMEAYRAAREENDHSTEVSEGDDISSALVERVRLPYFLNFI